MIDLKSDFKKILKGDLDKNKIVYEDNNDLLQFMIMFYDTITRIPIVGKKYNVIFSKELDKKILILPLKTKECIDDIVNRLSEGKSITTYLSKSTLNSNTRDNVLQNWGIYHAHVKRVSLDYNKPAERSELLLFFTIVGEKIYFIDVKSHPKGSGWFDKELIEIIYDNWKELLQVIEGATGLSPELQDNMVHKMSQTLGIAITVRGKIVMPTTLGNTTAGNSVNSTMWAQKRIRNLNNSEKELQNNLETIKSTLEKENDKKLEKPLDIHLVKTIDGDFKLYETNFNKYI